MADGLVRENKPWKYFLLTFGLSWLFWIPAAYLQVDMTGSPWVILLYLGGIGPAAAGILLSHIGSDAAARRDYWSRVFDGRRIGRGWILVILFSYPVLSAAAAYLVRGGIQLSDPFRAALAHPLQLAPFLFFLYLFGPFPEELGWRGYALDGLQQRIDPGSSSLLLGSCWAIWHLPLFLMRGTYQNELGFGSLEFWIFIFSAVAISIFFTWIYNHNQRSILSASLFHFSVNLTGNIFIEDQTIRLVRLVFLLVLAAGLVLLTRSNGLLGYSESTGQPGSGAQAAG